MSATTEFDELFSLAYKHAKQCNSVQYHPCCDSWTTKTSSKKRASHKQHLTWGDLVSKLPLKEEERKAALKEMMIRQKWRLSATVNAYCKSPIQIDIESDLLAQ